MPKSQNHLSQHYDDCHPMREFYQKLDAAVKQIKVWPEGRKPKGYGSRGQITPGLLVLIKSNRKPAMLIRHESWKGVVNCYGDGGPIIADRDEVILPKVQSALTAFKPMRLWLLYGG